MWLYGGLIRGLVLRNEVHDEMHLDADLPAGALDLRQPWPFQLPSLRTQLTTLSSG